MVCFIVQIGFQTQFFTGSSYSQCAQQAIAAGVPALSIKAGQFFDRVELDQDSKAQALIDSL